MDINARYRLRGDEKLTLRNMLLQKRLARECAGRIQTTFKLITWLVTKENRPA